MIINFNTAQLTIRAVTSCLGQGIRAIVVVDNASESEDLGDLRNGCSRIDNADVRVVSLDRNLGFSGGVNHGVDRIQSDFPDWTHLLLLNSDAYLLPDFRRSWEALARQGECDLVGGRVDAARPGESMIESAGMTLHRCLIASEIRLPGSYPVLGPTGAFAVVSKRLVVRLIGAHGHFLAPNFFCYAEDTDMCLRARLLGFSAKMLSTDVPVAQHEGQASSAGKQSDFIFFHGIRNSIWMAIRCIPAWLLARCAGWLLLAHGGLLVRSAFQGRLLLMLRIYWQTLGDLGRLLRERKRIQASVAITRRSVLGLLSRRFYDPSYLRGILGSITSFLK